MTAWNRENDPKKKKARLISDKNSTPGDGGDPLSDCLWQKRPHAVSTGVSTGAIGGSSSARMSAILQYGNIEVQTCHKLISLWESMYISQILPFVLPAMGFGPDDRWRRRDP